jgi:hypothetical protein
MKRTMKILPFALMLFAHAHPGRAQAPQATQRAGTDGHGAGGYYCKTDGGVEVKLLDLVEGELDHHWKYSATGGTVEDQLQRALGKIDDEAFLQSVQLSLQIVRDPSRQLPVPKGRGLPFPTDAKPHFDLDEESSCKPVGIALFHDGDIEKYDDDRLEVNFRLVDRLGPLGQAALWMHEAVYRSLRIAFLEADSIHARRIVGCLFSDEPSCQVPILTVHAAQPARLTVDGDRSYKLAYERKYERTPHLYSLRATMLPNQADSCYQRAQYGFRTTPMDGGQHISVADRYRAFGELLAAQVIPATANPSPVVFEFSGFYKSSQVCVVEIEVFSGDGTLVQKFTAVPNRNEYASYVVVRIHR